MKTWADRQEERSIHLELSQHKARGCWKKYRDGKTFYLKHPLTKEGYEAALLEWSQIVARLDGERPNAQQYHHHRDAFRLVQNWYDHFGVPKDETKLAKQVEQFLEWIEEQLKQPELPYTMPVLAFASSTRRPEFCSEFIMAPGTGGFGSVHFRLPPKWQERIRQMDDSPKSTKLPQTVEFWIEQYLDRVKSRGQGTTTIGTAKDRIVRLGKYKTLADTSKHVTTITTTTIEKYHDELEKLPLSKASKEGYFSAFKMFVRWASRNEDCELYGKAPENLDSNELTFREANGTGRKRLAKKKMLWTPEEFATALKNVPQPFRCYLVLSLNCGFRSTDLNALRKDDLHLKIGRLIIQRQKMNQNETSPVVSYPLWQKTVDLLKEAMSDDPVFVFSGRRGNRLITQKFEGGEPKIYDNLSLYWNRHRKDFGLDRKRLDYIRKTGATEVQRHNRGIETLYLGEALDEVAKINYAFNDGEPCADLDGAILELGMTFGLVKDARKRSVKMSSELLTSLERKARSQGLTLEQMLAKL
jgi:integrase